MKYETLEMLYWLQPASMTAFWMLVVSAMLLAIGVALFLLEVGDPISRKRCVIAFAIVVLSAIAIAPFAFVDTSAARVEALDK